MIDDIFLDGLYWVMVDDSMLDVMNMLYYLVFDILIWVIVLYIVVIFFYVVYKK